MCFRGCCHRDVGERSDFQKETVANRRKKQPETLKLRMDALHPRGNRAECGILNSCTVRDATMSARGARKHRVQPD